MNATALNPANDQHTHHRAASFSAGVCGFSARLFAACGGWLDRRVERSGAAKAAVSEQRIRAELFSLAARADLCEPGLAAELRYLAKR